MIKRPTANRLRGIGIRCPNRIKYWPSKKWIIIKRVEKRNFGKML